MIKKRERAVFLGNRLRVRYSLNNFYFLSGRFTELFDFNLLQEFSEDYHAKKSLDATVSDNVTGSIIGGRTLMRSNSIQDELLTTF